MGALLKRSRPMNSTWRCTPFYVQYRRRSPYSVLYIERHIGHCYAYGLLLTHTRNTYRLITVQKISVADGSASEALQTYEQYMEMYIPSMYSTGDVHLTVYCT